MKSDRVEIGVLAKEGPEFVFKYAESFLQRTDLPSLSAFPDRTREYRSRHLWPFFAVRLPPLDREDIAEIVRAQALDPADPMALLAVLGRKTVTSPYELRPKGRQ
jgi:HipA-like protein